MNDEDEKLNNKKNNKIKYILLGVLILVILIVVICCVETENDINQENSKELSLEEQEKEEERLKAKVKDIEIIDNFRTINNELGLVLFNKGNEAVSDFKIEVVCYDENRKPIEILYSSADIVEPNEKYYLIISKLPNKYADFDVLISKDFGKEYYHSRKNDVSFKEVEDTKSRKIIEVKNNSNKKIDQIKLKAIYYDNENKIIDVDNLYVYDLKGNKSKEETAYKELYSSKGQEKIDYERMEIILQNAYDTNY